VPILFGARALAPGAGFEPAVSFDARLTAGWVAVPHTLVWSSAPVSNRPDLGYKSRSPRRRAERGCGGRN